MASAVGGMYNTNTLRLNHGNYSDPHLKTMCIIASYDKMHSLTSAASQRSNFKTLINDLLKIATDCFSHLLKVLINMHIY